MEDPKYPVFRNPDAYMKMRHQATLTGWLKLRTEFRALDRCLAELADVRTICDVPTGPGRLFPYWRRRGYAVRGFDYSDEMVAADGPGRAVR